MRQSLQQRVDAREALLRALLDAVLQRGVSLLGRLEAHRLGQLRLLAEILELERLQVVLERLHEPRGGHDLAELALDDAEGRSEPVGPPGRTSISSTTVPSPHHSGISSGSVQTE